METMVPKGIKIGHADNNYTGVSVIISESGCVAGADIRGGAPGTHETDLLKTEKAMRKINAVVLCGGSAYGLGAISGVMEILRSQNVGFKIDGKVVPICCGAVIYDLNDEEYHYPDMEMGKKAVENSMENNTAHGNIGAGKGAYSGKIRGIKNATKTGLGIATVKVQGITITAVVVVNALGDIVDYEKNEILAGAKDNKGNFLNTEKCILDGEYLRLILGTNTTIGCIITDAKITKEEANKLATIAHNGLAKTIRPVHTDYDGDSLFVMATGKKKPLNFMLLSVGAVEATAKAVINATEQK